MFVPSTFGGLARFSTTRGCCKSARLRGRWPASQARRTSASYILKSQYGEPDIPECNFAHKVMQDWKVFGSKTAVVEAGTNRSYTYTQLSDSVTRFASALRKLGFKEKDTLCICSANSPEYPIVLFSTLAIGGIVTPANPLYTKEELVTLLTLSKAKVIVCMAQKLSVMQEAIASLPQPGQVKCIISLGAVNPNDGAVAFSSLLNNDGSSFDGTVVAVNSREDVACLPFSSGTTGLPKGVMLTHHNLTSNVVQLRREPFFPVTTADSMAVVIPFFHIYGLMLMSTSLSGGSLLVTYPKFDPVLFFSTIEKYRINTLPIVPPIILFMNKDPMLSRFDLSCVHHITSGSSALSEVVSKEFVGKFPHVKSLCQGYGLTETSPMTHMNPRSDWRLGSVGVLLAGVQARITNVDTGADCGPNVEGELLLKGPNIMKGYFENPEANAQTLIGGGWMRTGDIAYYDKDGYFFIVDRLKELIKYKGIQVPPAELEAVLLSHPAVREAAVVGVPDEEAGELPRAYVSLNPGQEVTAEVLMNYVAARVAPSKKLRGGIKFIADVPKSSTGKFLRRLLKAEAVGKPASK